MKLRVLFLKKKSIYYAILLLTILILFSIFLLTRKSTTTFSTVTDNTIIKADINGDSVEDFIYIKPDKEKYSIQVNTKDTSLLLKTDAKLNSLGNYSSTWPMKVTLLDVNRDRVPEIFVQAQEKNIPVQHIFSWNNGDFKDIYCASNNLIGFIDCKNNKTPKIISANLSNGEISQTNYVLINQGLQSFNFSSNKNFIGKDSVLSFINYIQGLPSSETSKPENIFYPGLSGSSLSDIGKMSADNSTFLFQDGLFMDTKWTKDGDISEAKWVLNFKGTSNQDSSLVKLYKVTLLLKPLSTNVEESNYFRINSIACETN